MCFNVLGLMFELVLTYCRSHSCYQFWRVLQKLKLSKLIYDRIPKTISKWHPSSQQHFNRYFRSQTITAKRFLKRTEFCIEGDITTIKVEFGNDVLIHWTVLKWRSFKITSDISNFCKKVTGWFYELSWKLVQCFAKLFREYDSECNILNDF